MLTVHFDDEASVPASSMVAVPTLQQRQQYGQAGVAKTCGGCRHFNLAEGQRRLFRQKLLAVIVNDHGWKQYFLGAPPEKIGVCGQTDVLTGSTHISCEHYRAK